MSTTPTTQNRKRNRLVIGAVAAVIAVALAAGAAYWWQDRNELSQASAEDCRLAQRIITEAEAISTGPVADAEKWWRKTGDERRAQMKDGYLGAKISQYEGWALETARKSPEAPSAKDVKNLQEEAQGHCSDSGVTLSMPPLGS
ncbi:hypothetical protein B046DRAFT_05389 [Streptomyces sp. LamerLS-316]|uniref:hypothetical protein n=1 Tax=unclassified Streptomyces TaxID=2593676 RepID=UPI0008238F7C|nr:MULTISPECIES: hypothetical protein [unclassified Streptomyces]MYQ36734.1 hypothetical protein [Streptomyces sp. SID4921]SCK50789.1 hypothetical protein B046DRAFT_05389 [Streptomyces sp. LamerLS-316]